MAHKGEYKGRTVGVPKKLRGTKKGHKWAEKLEKKGKKGY